MQRCREHPCRPVERRRICVRKLLVGLVVGALWHSAGVYAEGSTSPDGSNVPLLLFSGFGTFGTAHLLRSQNDAHIAVSLATVEFMAHGAGTRLIVTAQGAFLDGYDDAGSREKSTRVLLDRLDAVLRREAARSDGHAGR